MTWPIPPPIQGTKTNAYAGSITGNAITVQGNMLASPAVLQAVFIAAVKAQEDNLPIQDILMLAMESGAANGGDKRSGERKASSAFLTASKPGDTEKHWLNLVVDGDDGHTHAGYALRKKFDAWKAKEITTDKKSLSTYY